MKKLRLLVVDDQALFREGLVTLLAMQPDFEIAGEASNGAEAVAAFARLKPDVVLMDLRMPVKNGVDATREIIQADAGARVIVLTTFEDDEEVFGALHAGAAGYLLKAAPSERVVEAIRIAARGESVLHPSVAARVIAEFNRMAQKENRVLVQPLAEPLSPRELEVLRLLSEGCSNKEIGSQLDIAEGTVKNHMTNVLGKLGVLDRTQAALKARELGLT